MLMAENGDTEVVTALLEGGADCELQDFQGMTALHSACKSGVTSCVDALLDSPCKLDKVTTEKCSPLHTACWSGNIHAVTSFVVRTAEDFTDFCST